MNPHILLFSTVGEWLAANATAIIAIVVTVGLTGLVPLLIYLTQIGPKLVYIEDRVKETGSKLDKVSDEVQRHIGDADKHVNHLFMRTLETRMDKTDGRLDKLETTMSNGFDKLGDKLDALSK